LKISDAIAENILESIVRSENLPTNIAVQVTFKSPPLSFVYLKMFKYDFCLSTRII